MCVYFDDLLSDHDYYYYIDKGWLTQKEYESISEWHHILAKYNSPNNMDDDNMAVLNDNKWIDIVNIGETARNNLLQLLNKTERNILNIK